MAERTARATAKRASRASGARRPAAGTTKTANAGTKATPNGEGQRVTGKTASRLIDERIRSLGGWRAKTLADVRRTIGEADPDIPEGWKWRGTPVWRRAGNVCTR